jgi:hypothetical protein
VPAQLLYLGLLVAPLAVAGFVVLWRTPGLRFPAITATLVLGCVLAWIPGKVYYADGIAPAVLAAGALAAGRWIARARRPRVRRWTVLAASLAGVAVAVASLLPILPVSDVRNLPVSSRQSSPGDTIGWPQLTAAVTAQDAALARAGQPPATIFTGYYAKAAALDVPGPARHQPPVLSAHNAYRTWGPGHASDRTVLTAGALSQLRPYFASCRLLTTYHVSNDWTSLQIGLCTRPHASWHTPWPHLKHYG